MHHIFVECPNFEEIREESKEKTEEAINKILDTLPEGQRQSDDSDRIRNITRHALEDDPHTWPLGVSRYYLGHIPKLSKSTQDKETPDNISGRTRRQVHNELHNAFIRLAGRIFGTYTRLAAKQDGIREKRKF
jgi:hypothetical protein